MIVFTIFTIFSDIYKYIKLITLLQPNSSGDRSLQTKMLSENNGLLWSSSRQTFKISIVSLDDLF